MRVVVVTSQEVAPTIRFGHAVANNGPDVARLVRPMMMTTSTEFHEAGTSEQHDKGRRPCLGRLREKAFRMSNAFRQALGLPLIEMHPKLNGKVHGGMIQILPFIGTPVHANIMSEDKTVNAFGEVNNGEGVHFLPVDRPHHHHHHYHTKHRKTFLNRIHRALMALGPWEGRAVAFVLGKSLFTCTSTKCCDSFYLNGC